MERKNNIVFFELRDTEEKIVARYGTIKNLPLIFQQKSNDNFSDDIFRNVYRTEKGIGSIRVVTTRDDWMFLGSKNVTRLCFAYLDLIPCLADVKRGQRQSFDSIIRRFAHNLTKFQTRFKGNFNRLISDTARSRPFSDFKLEVKRRIENNIEVAAEDVCQISHRATDLDAQIDTLRIISGYAEDSPISLIKVDLQKTIFRLTNPFFEEFRKKGIEVKINIPNLKMGIEKFLIEPGLFNAAFWQLLDNASKYTMENTEIEIKSTLKTPKRLEMVMQSICIDDDEKNLIFLEGYKGKHAGNKSEYGIGLFIVEKALDLMDAKIHVENGCFSQILNGFNYGRNSFVIEFKSD